MAAVENEEVRKVVRRLPQDLVEEVQVRLPARSLIRFKSVCKRWLSKIESGAFIALYNHHHQHPDPSSEVRRTTSLADLKKMVPGLDVGYECRTLKTKLVVGVYWRRIYQVFGPVSNGIYCLTSHDMRADNCSLSVLSGKIAVCNPGTGQYKFAEPFPREFRPMLSDISCFLRGRPPCFLHLGFGNVDDDYRVVALIQYGRIPCSFLVFVYSLQRREWKKIVDYVPGKRKVGKPKATDAFDGRRIRGILYDFGRCSQRFFNGCFHWAVSHKDDSFSVLAFNFADQSFKLLGGPPPNHHMVTTTTDDNNNNKSDDDLCKGGKALVLHDHLAFITQFLRPAASHRPRWAMQDVEVDVWMMMEYGVQESWTRIYTINPDYNGHFNSLDGIDYEEDEQSPGGIRIKRLFLGVRRRDDDKRAVISCDSVGHQVIQIAQAGQTIYYDVPGVIRTCEFQAYPNDYWNTPAIPTYIETLERL